MCVFGDAKKLSVFFLSYDMTINGFHQFVASGWTKITCVTFELGGVGVLKFQLTTMCI
jgi:hypothetical protein